MKRKVLKVKLSSIMQGNGTFNKVATLECGHKVKARSMDQKTADCQWCKDGDQSKHGGARPGSGRKPGKASPPGRKMWAGRLPVYVVDWLAENATQEKSQAALIENAMVSVYGIKKPSAPS